MQSDSKEIIKEYIPNPVPRPPFSLAVMLLSKSLIDLVKPMKKAKKIVVNFDPKKIEVWVIGHATVLINFYGISILTDPVLVKGLPFPQRRIAPGMTLKEIKKLEKIDYVLISHAHMDHFNKRTLRAIAAKTCTLLISKNCSDLIQGMNFKKYREIDWSETYQDEHIKIDAYKPKHWGKRLPWEKMVRGYNSLIIQRKGKTIFFCGDSAYDDYFSMLGNKYQIDLAFMPIGAYNPDSFRKVHMNPEEAIQAMDDLKAAHMIPIHFENFRLSLEPISEPREKLQQQIVLKMFDQKVHILDNGQSFRLT